MVEKTLLSRQHCSGKAGRMLLNAVQQSGWGGHDLRGRRTAHRDTLARFIGGPSEGDSRTAGVHARPLGKG